MNPTPPNILLINAPLAPEYRQGFWAKSSSSPPLGLLSLATYMETHGYPVRVLDMLVNPLSRAEYLVQLEQWQPAVVGISLLAVNVPGGLQLAAWTKAALPGAATVLGGPQATYTAHELVCHSAVDYVVRGEGEQTFADLCSYLLGSPDDPPHHIPGLVFRCGQETVTTPQRALIEDLNTLPIPRRGLLDMTVYHQPWTLMTSRGCFGRCTFCGAADLWRRHCRYRSMEKVEEEIAYLSDAYHSRDLIVGDSTFTDHADRLTAFCHMMMRRPSHIMWSSNSRVDLKDDSLFQLMFQAGCRRVFFGVESGNDQVLAAVRKGVRRADIVRAVAAAAGVGIVPICSFILAHPSDTPDTLRDTADLMRQLHAQHGAIVLASMNTPYPGTWQYEHAAALGLVFRRGQWDSYVVPRVLVRTRYLTEKQILVVEQWKTECNLKPVPARDPTEEP